MARIKLDMPDSYIFETDIQVRITDVNYAGHLGNDSLLSIVHEARLRFLNHLGYSEEDIAGIGTIMNDAAIVYKSEAFYGDVLNIKIAVADISRKTCDFYYLLTKDEGKIVAHCKTGIVFYDYDLKKPVSAPQEFIEKVSG